MRKILRSLTARIVIAVLGTLLISLVAFMNARGLQELSRLLGRGGR